MPAPILPKHKLARARRLWEIGMDTAEIAWRLVAGEAQVYNSLDAMRGPVLPPTAQGKRK